jgi:pyridoxal phosphate enzyme (YggS family)
MASPELLQRNLEAVRARVRAAALRSGRDPGAVTVVAVTKTVGPDVAESLARLGHRDFGENRPQDLVAKREALAAAPGLPPVRWHMIGHFQRNKVRRSLPAMDVVHSLDSLPLAETISGEAVRAGRACVPVLVQVNVSGESSKGGFDPSGLGAALERIRGLPALSPVGLMTMAPWSDDPESARPVFRSLRELRDWARSSGYLAGSELSMGMSEDFDVAVEEGATVVRVGRALVGPSLV